MTHSYKRLKAIKNSIITMLVVEEDIKEMMITGIINKINMKTQNKINKISTMLHLKSIVTTMIL